MLRLGQPLRRMPWTPPGARRRADRPGRQPVRGQQAKAGEALLHQQFWCFRADIRRCEDNLLLAHGFAQTRTSVGTVGSTLHQRDTDRGLLALWGRGIWYGEPEDGSVFVRRYAFRPKWHASAVCPLTHTPEQLGCRTAPRASEAGVTRRLSPEPPRLLRGRRGRSASGRRCLQPPRHPVRRPRGARSGPAICGDAEMLVSSS
jgi:hypothetical protein